MAFIAAPVRFMYPEAMFPACSSLSVSAYTAPLFEVGQTFLKALVRHLGVLESFFIEIVKLEILFYLSLVSILLRFYFDFIH